MTMKSRCTAIVITGVLTIAGCGNTSSPEPSIAAPTAATTASDRSDATRLWIGPDVVDCEGAAPQTCLQVSEAADGEYEFFYDSIEGFDPQPGTSYVVDVEIIEIENPPADGSSLRYILIDVVEQSS